MKFKDIISENITLKQILDNMQIKLSEIKMRETKLRHLLHESCLIHNNHPETIKVFMLKYTYHDRVMDGFIAYDEELIKSIVEKVNLLFYEYNEIWLDRKAMEDDASTGETQNDLVEYIQNDTDILESKKLELEQYGIVHITHGYHLEEVQVAHYENLGVMKVVA